MKHLPLAAALAALFLSCSAHAAKFTYHGELMDGATPAEGHYDLRVRSFAQPGAKAPLGEPVELSDVMFSEGRFSIDLDIPENLHGTTWVDVAVRKSTVGGDYVALGDPQPIPMANGTCPGAWALDGNSGAPAGSFLGFVDDTQPLVLKVNNSNVAKFTKLVSPQFYGDTSNVVLGSSANIASGAAGATVGGGGATHGNASAGAPVVCPNCKNTAGANFSTVSGGISNTANGVNSTVGGGNGNTAGYGASSTVSGGAGNTASGAGSTVSGGNSNTASANSGAIGGGTGNVVGWEYSTVGGGGQNTANNRFSTVGGGYRNCAGGEASWAGGYRAKVRQSNSSSGDAGVGCNGVASSGDSNGDEGTFVWADSQNQNVDFTSTGSNQFLIRADGGVGINTATFGNAADLRLSELVIANTSGHPNADLVLLNKPANRGYNVASAPGTNGAAGEFTIDEVDARTSNVVFTHRLLIDASGKTFVKDGSVGNLSDARLKKNLAPIEKPLDTLLALHGRTFEYIDPAASMNSPGPRMGFIAQEVQSVLPNWVKPTGDKGYLSVTPIGFEALTVEAIRDLKAESDVRIEQLQAENATLHASLDALTARLAKLESRQEK